MDVARQRSGGRRKEMLLSQYRRIGGCSKSSGTITPFWKAAGSFKGFTEAIIKVEWCSSVRSRSSVRLSRWPSIMKWQKSYRNSKYPKWIPDFSLLIIPDLLCFVSYRGYYSRKYEHDFYARKTYLNHVQTKNEEVRKKLAEYQRQMSLEE